MTSPQKAARDFRRRLNWSLAAVTGAAIFGYQAPLLGLAADNLRLISVFSADEALHVELLREALATGLWRIDFINYGHLPMNAALLVLSLLGAPQSDSAILIALRGVSVAGALAVAFFLHRLARELFDERTAWISVALACLTPASLLHWSVRSHPDVPQLAFLLASLWMLSRVRTGSRQSSAWAAVFAGLAFACKYSGLLVLPLIGVAVVARARRHDAPMAGGARAARICSGLIGGLGLLAAGIVTPTRVALLLSADGVLDGDGQLSLITAARVFAAAAGFVFLGAASSPRLWRWMRRRPQRIAVVWDGLIALGCFLAAFTIASPWSWLRLGFIKGMHFESRHLGFGHRFESAHAAYDWPAVIASDAGWWVGALALVGAFVITTRREHRRALAVLGGFGALYAAVLVTGVRISAARHALPLAPVWWCAAAVAIIWAAHRLRARVPRLGYQVLTVALVAALVTPLALRANHLRQTRVAEARDGPSIRLARWLTEHRDPVSSVVVYEPGTYVPPSFARAHATWAGTDALLDEVMPDVVLSNDSLRARFEAPTAAARYADGLASFSATRRYYLRLDREYRPAKTIGGLTAWVKLKPR